MSSIADEIIMVVSTKNLWKAGYFQGVTFEVGKYLNFINEPDNIKFLPRKFVESDSTFKQVIPYAIIVHAGNVFSYRRGKLLGEKRLLGQRSIGVGGHITSSDRSLFVKTYEEGMLRELREEVNISSKFENRIEAFINDDSNDVGRVHLGIVHIVRVMNHEVAPKEKSMNEAGFVPSKRLVETIGEYENWSKMCISELSKLLPDH